MKIDKSKRNQPNNYFFIKKNNYKRIARYDLYRYFRMLNRSADEEMIGGIEHYGRLGIVSLFLSLCY